MGLVGTNSKGVPMRRELKAIFEGRVVENRIGIGGEDHREIPKEARTESTVGVEWEGVDFFLEPESFSRSVTASSAASARDKGTPAQRSSPEE